MAPCIPPAGVSGRERILAMVLVEGADHCGIEGSQLLASRARRQRLLKLKRLGGGKKGWTATAAVVMAVGLSQEAVKVSAILLTGRLPERRSLPSAASRQRLMP